MGRTLAPRTSRIQVCSGSTAYTWIDPNCLPGLSHMQTLLSSAGLRATSFEQRSNTSATTSRRSRTTTKRNLRKLLTTSLELGPTPQHYIRQSRTPHPIVITMFRLAVAAYQQEQAQAYQNYLDMYYAQPIVVEAVNEEAPFKFLALPEELRRDIYRWIILGKLEVRIRPHKKYLKRNINAGIRFLPGHRLAALAGTCQQVYGEIDTELFTYAITSLQVKLVANVKDTNFTTPTELVKSFSGLGKDEKPTKMFLLLTNATQPKLIVDLEFSEEQIDSKKLGRWFTFCKLHGLNIEYSVTSIERPERFLPLLTQLQTAMDGDADMSRITQAAMDYQMAVNLARIQAQAAANMAQLAIQGPVGAADGGSEEGDSGEDEEEGDEDAEMGFWNGEEGMEDDADEEEVQEDGLEDAGDMDDAMSDESEEADEDMY
ncbi:hypothetical protein LTS10_000064 [Elasticomyces elasticus]|nr:hypothetical protein LTS10_000064 [Elasticomyces elasticus]